MPEAAHLHFLKVPKIQIRRPFIKYLNLVFVKLTNNWNSFKISWMKRFIFEKENLAPISNFQKSGNNFAVSRLEFRVLFIETFWTRYPIQWLQRGKKKKIFKKGETAASTARPRRRRWLRPGRQPLLLSFQIPFRHVLIIEFNFSSFSRSTFSPLSTSWEFVSLKKKIVWKILKICYRFFEKLNQVNTFRDKKPSFN